MRNVTFVFAAFVFCQPATAQDSELCNAVLDFGIRNNFNAISQQSRYEQFRDIICELDHDTKTSFFEAGGEVGVIVPLMESILGIDAGGDTSESTFQSRRQEYCSSSFVEGEFSDIFVVQSNPVSQVLTTAWNNCHRDYINAWVSQRNLDVSIEVTPAAEPDRDGRHSFDISLTRHSNVGGRLEIENYSRPNEAECEVNGRPAIGYRTTSRSILLNCRKNPSTSIGFRIQTSEGQSNLVTIPALPNEVDEMRLLYSRLLRQVNELESALHDTQSELATAQAALGEIGSAQGISREGGLATGAGRTWRSESRCPAGEYVAGVAAYDNDATSNSCPSCMTGLQVLCRDLRSDD